MCVQAGSRHYHEGSSQIQDGCPAEKPQFHITPSQPQCCKLNGTLHQLLQGLAILSSQEITNATGPEFCCDPRPGMYTYIHLPPPTDDPTRHDPVPCSTRASLGNQLLSFTFAPCTMAQICSSLISSSHHRGLSNCFLGMCRGTIWMHWFFCCTKNFGRAMSAIWVALSYPRSS